LGQICNIKYIYFSFTYVAEGLHVTYVIGKGYFSLSPLIGHS